MDYMLKDYIYMETTHLGICSKGKCSVSHCNISHLKKFQCHDVYLRSEGPFVLQALSNVLLVVIHNTLYF